MKASDVHSSTKDDVLNYVTQHGPIVAGDVADGMGLARFRVDQCLRDLAEAGFVISAGAGRRRSWTVPATEMGH